MKIRPFFPKKLIFSVPAAVLMVLMLLPAARGNDQTVDLRPSTSTRQIWQVKTWVEGKGVVAPLEKDRKRLKLKARFDYQERVIARSKHLKSIRDYENALAKITLDGKPTISQLDADHRIVIAQTRDVDHPVRLASLGGPLTQKEFELIDSSANTLILSSVLARDDVTEGESWTPNQAELARFLNIDSVSENNVEFKLDSVRGSNAVLMLSGVATGQIDAAVTRMTINGTANYDLKVGMVTRLDLKLDQERNLGLMQPALNATFRILTTIEPTNSSQRLSNEGLAKLRESAGNITDQLMLTPAATEIALLHPRAWRVISDNPKRTTLRYLNRGRVLGQCDIIPLPKRLKDQNQTLDQFQSVVETKLADNNVEITASDQAVTSNGIRWMRVDASGESQGVPLHWIYYTLTHEDGRRVQLVFTIEPDNLSMFSGSEDDLVQSLRFVQPGKPSSRNASYSK